MQYEMQNQPQQRQYQNQPQQPPQGQQQRPPQQQPQQQPQQWQGQGQWQQQPQNQQGQYQQRQQGQPGQYQVTNAICKINGNKKVVDFRNCMAVAEKSDAAALHGAGGKHGRRSVIKLTICDYSRGTGNASVTVDANLEPSTVRMLYEVAKDRILGRGVDKLHATQNAAEALKILRGGAKAGGLSGDALVAAGKAVANVMAALGATPGNDYEYSFQKLNPYDSLGNGRFKATKLTISHQALAKDGSPSRYPWFISIDQGSGVNNAKDGRTVIGQYQSEKKVFVNVSDADMFAALSKVVRTIEVWEQSVAGPLFVQSDRQRQGQGNR